MNLLFRGLKLLFYISFRPIWWLEKLIKRDKNIWVFSSWDGMKYNDNSRALYEYVANNCPEIKSYWILRDEKLIKSLIAEGVDCFLENSKECRRILRHCGKIFTVRDNEFTTLSLININGCEWYQLWHGMPLKKIKDDYLDGIVNQSKLKKVIELLVKKLTPWSPNAYNNRYTVTSSDFFTPFLSSSFGIKIDKIIKTGLPRCDMFFRQKKEPLLETIRSKYVGCTIVLYMPTFRTSQFNGVAFNPFVDIYKFDRNRFYSFLENENIVFLYKAHSIDLKYMSTKQNDSERFKSINDSDYFEMYNFIGQIDVLLTDYSSIYFDFLITRKPIILTPFDYEDYIHKARAHYFNYFDEMEGVKAMNWNEVESILKNKSYYPVSEPKIKQFAEFADGKSCENLVQQILTESK